MEHDKNNNDCLCDICLKQLFFLARKTPSKRIERCANCGKTDTLINWGCATCLTSASTAKPFNNFGIETRSGRVEKRKKTWTIKKCRDCNRTLLPKLDNFALQICSECTEKREKDYVS